MNIKIKPTFNKADIELIESIVYKSADDIAISIARSFERLEERMDDVNARLYARIGEVDDRLCETIEKINPTK